MNLLNAAVGFVCLLCAYLGGRAAIDASPGGRKVRSAFAWTAAGLYGLAVLVLPGPLHWGGLAGLAVAAFAIGYGKARRRTSGVQPRT